MPLADFLFYFKLGWTHIVSLDALDHQLFILALVTVYTSKNLKQVLILVTAFTIGHSLTLLLSVLDVFRFPSKWVEFLIPCTIVITAFSNLFKKDFSNKAVNTNYYLALLFGLIHGMGFANTIRMMLMKKESITVPLLGFNLGLEAGQIVVVTAILLLGFLVVTKAGLSRKLWVGILSGSALLVAGYICVQRWPL